MRPRPVFGPVPTRSLVRHVATPLSVVALALLSGPALAQEGESLDDLLGKSLGELMDLSVVTASRVERPLSDAPANILVVTAEQIEQRGYRNMIDLLRDLPGFDFSTLQPAGEYPAHFHLRGIGDVGQTQVLVMVDGVVQNDISNGWVRLLGNEMGLGDVERVEIISGPGSALYGSNAYAGIIHIITRSADSLFAADSDLPVAGDVRLRVGTETTVVPEALLAMRWDNGLTAQVYGRWYLSRGDDGLDRLDPGNYFHGNYEPDEVLTTEHGVIANELEDDGSRKALADGFDTSINDAFLRARFALGGVELGMSFWDRREGLGSEVVGYEYFANTDGIPYSAHHRGYSIHLAGELELSERASNQTRMYHRNTSILPGTEFVYTYRYQSVDNGVDEAVVDKTKNYNGHGFVTGVESTFELAASEFDDIVFGVRAEREIKQYFGIALGEEQDPSSTIVSSTYPSNPTDAAGESSVAAMYNSTNLAAFGQLEHRFGPDWIFNAGARADWSSAWGLVMTPRVALVAHPVEAVTFKALYGSAFKAPTVFELYDEWRGNPNLLPERIQTLEGELGYRWQDKVGLRANYFFSILVDGIEESANPDESAVPVGPNGELATYFQNGDPEYVHGVVVMADVRPIEGLRLDANYSYTGRPDGSRLDNISAHKLNFGANYLMLDRVALDLRGNLVGRAKAPATNLYFHPKDEDWVAGNYDYVTAEDPDGYAPAYFVMNLTLTGINLFGPDVDLRPQLGVRNLLGADYFTLGRQSGSGTRPVDELQPTIANPAGFSPPYHPQPGRELLVGLEYSF